MDPNTSRGSEFALIARIRAALADGGPGVRVGVGDDAAVLVPPRTELLVTTDTLVEGVHFRFEWAQAAEVGRKAASTNLSDIAAMGGEPRWATAALCLPADFGQARFDELFEALVGQLAAHGATLVGGNLTRSPGPWVVTLTIIGAAAASGPLRRSGARVGDVIWVLGTLGDAALALRMLEAGARPETRTAAPWRALLDPLPHTAFGTALGRSGLAHAAIDVSDGLVQDLGHVCQESGVGAEVGIADLPVSAAFHEHIVTREAGPDPWDLAAGGGEDYALLFTAAPEAAEALQRLRAESGDEGPLAPIGRIVAGAPEVRLHLHGRPYTLVRRGFDHFE